MLKALLLIAMPLIAAACTSLTPEVREKVTPGLDFADVQADPSGHVGQSLMLGGALVEVRGEGEGSMLQLLRWNLNRWGEPHTLAESGDLRSAARDVGRAGDGEIRRGDRGGL